MTSTSVRWSSVTYVVPVIVGTLYVPGGVTVSVHRIGEFCGITDSDANAPAFYMILDIVSDVTFVEATPILVNWVEASDKG